MIAVRSAVPLRNQLQLWIGERIRRTVPQLERDGRIELFERIQTNSIWNFDFILLIALSTIIAALGLLDNSAAVIIGAMLVAPLMTPLLGLGLAIAQGNAYLARMMLKTSALGFLTAFALAYAVGLVSQDFYEPTGEMIARDWPQLLDLVIAFVSGLAAAYASGRPGLLAALPGVAIAAALLPPIATSGLSLSIGNYDLALNALLLFAVNMVAIVIAAAVALQAVGIRDLGKTNVTTRWLGNALIVLTVVLALSLTFLPPRVAPARSLVTAVEGVLAEEYRLRRIRLNRQVGRADLQVDVGGSELPHAKLQRRLRDVARQHLGADTAVHLTFRYEAVVR